MSNRAAALLLFLSLLCPLCTHAADPPAPVPRTGQTASYAAGDDGAIQAGVPSPDPRFTDNGDGTVRDALTGLVWLKDANCFDQLVWTDAVASANKLAHGTCGLSDASIGGQWRLPSLRELESLLDTAYISPSMPAVRPFSNIQEGGYWSSSIGTEGTSAWFIYMNYATVFNYNTGWSYYVWPVRDGQTGNPPAPVARTGVTATYVTGDDGALQKGIPWPIPRFTDNGNGTVTDNLTGLIWLKNAGCFTPQPWGLALPPANNLASGACGLTDGSSPGDWRLPNWRELRSLLDYGVIHPSLPQRHPFSNLRPANYWTSDSYAGGTSYAYYVNLDLGGMDVDSKGATYNIWPVRSGSSTPSFDQTTGTALIPRVRIAGDTSGALFRITLQQQGQGLTFAVAEITPVGIGAPLFNTATYNIETGDAHIPILVISGDTSGASYAVDLQFRDNLLTVTQITPR